MQVRPKGNDPSQNSLVAGPGIDEWSSHQRIADQWQAGAAVHVNRWTSCFCWSRLNSKSMPCVFELRRQEAMVLGAKVDFNMIQYVSMLVMTPQIRRHRIQPNLLSTHYPSIHPSLFIHFYIRLSTANGDTFSTGVLVWLIFPSIMFFMCKNKKSTFLHGVGITLQFISISNLFLYYISI